MVYVVSTFLAEICDVYRELSNSDLHDPCKFWEKLSELAEV